MTSTLRRAGAATLIAAIAATALTGCGGVGAKLTFSDAEKAKITDIVVSGRSGDVLIRTDQALTETKINRIVHRNSDPGDSYKLTGSTLTLNTDCGPNCRVSYDITTPPGVKVRGSLGSGDLGVSGVSGVDVSLDSGNVLVSEVKGDVTAKADSGDVTITDTTGKVTASADSGDVRAVKISGGPVDLRADSGDVDLEALQPMSVTAVADSGNVTARVPAGHYAINTDARSGDEQVGGPGLIADQGAKFKLTMAADSGDVTLVSLPGSGGDPSGVPAAPDAPQAPTPAQTS
jgi:putative adhesin